MWLYLVLILSLLSGAPEEDGSLLEAAPTDAWLVMSMEDLGDLQGYWEESPLKRFLDDPEVKPLVDKMESFISDEMDEDDAEGLDLFSRFCNSISGDVVFFATDFDPLTEEIGLALLIEPGEGREEFEGCWTEIKEHTYNDEDGTDLSSESYNDVDLDIIDGPEGEDPGRFIIGDDGRVAFFVFHTDKERCLESARTLVDRLAGEGEVETLADNELLHHAREKSGGAQNFEFFMNLEVFVSKLPAVEEIAFVGLDDLKSLYFTMNMSEGDPMRTASCFHVEGEGLIRQFVDQLMGDPPTELLEYIPAEAVQFSVSRVDINGMYKLGMQTFKEQSEEQYNMIKPLIDGMIMMQTGLELEKDLLEQLDGRIGTFALKRTKEEEIAVTKNAGSGMPTTIMELYIIGLTDPATFKANIDTALTTLQLIGTLKEDEFQGEKIYSLPILDPNYTPTWAFADDVFAISLFPSQVRAFLRQQGSAEKTSVEIPENLKAMMEEFSPYTGLTKANIPNMLAMMSKAMKDAFAQETIPGSGEWLELFPSRAVIEKYFTGDIGSVIVVDSEGALWVTENF